MRTFAKGVLSKINFAIGNNPKVVESDNWTDYIPSGYQAALTITADFELAWAPRYSHKHKDPLSTSILYAQRERRNVPKILQVSNEYNIPITWATVGHLFLDKCELTGERKHDEIPQVPAYKGKYWGFQGGDWFEYDPCTNVEKDPEWYAPDLIDLILSAGVGHEIGCHTFSHIDCRDDICPRELFESEVQRCIDLANLKGLKMTSFVHPGHTIGNLASLANLGFTSFQSDPGNILGIPIKHSGGLYELQRTMIFDLRPDWSKDYHIYRYKKIIDRAIENHSLCNFWFHPSLETIFVTDILPEVFRHIDERRSEIYISTVGDYVQHLNT